MTLVNNDFHKILTERHSVRRFDKSIKIDREEMKEMLTDFAEFRHSRTLKDRIIRINAMEEEADRLYMSAMRKIHTGSKDPLIVISWREIYAYLESCADACEHVADAVESVVMKNS